MAAVARLREYLDGHGIKYTVISHSKAYTAQELAASTHIRGRNFAKSVVVKAADKFLLVVIPAHHHVRLDAIGRAVGTDALLATESEFKDLFPGCEVGAMPPFGNLYNLPVWASETLARDDEMAFNAGTHTDAIRMSYRDFDRLVKARLGPWSEVALHPPRAEPEL